jgi:nitrite reductase (NADH) large subunit
MKVILVGHGMVGQKFLEALHTQAPGAVEVTVLCEEPRPAYDRVHLSSFFSGTTAEALSLVPPDFFTETGYRLHLNDRAVAIDRAAQTVTTASGAVLAYDRLVLATGSYPFVPPLPGRDRPDCFVYRTIEDLLAMQACGARSKTGVVVGGGLLGLECAKALHDMGLQTHVVEFAPRLMAVQVDEGGGRVLRRKIEALGVRVHTQKNTTEIIDCPRESAGVDGETTTHRMVFADGSCLDTDMIVFSAGIRPRDELARAAGLAIGERGGIVIDDACTTSDPAIFAIGECALHRGRIYGLVAPGYEMARVAAAQLVAQAPSLFPLPPLAGGEGQGEGGGQWGQRTAPSAQPSPPAPLPLAGEGRPAAVSLAANALTPPSAPPTVPPSPDGRGTVVPPSAAITFRGADLSTKLKLMGVDVASLGDAHGSPPGCLSTVYVDERKGLYKKLVTCSEGKQLLGGVLVGDAREFGTLLQLMLNGIPLPADPETLILPASDGAPKAGIGVDLLPESAQICSCNNVSKGDLCAAVSAGATSVGALKTGTKAGSSCGGCLPLVTQVLKAELTRQGVAVNNHLCEHFPYSRQALYHLVRIGEIKTFDALIARHGSGHGCDICKPVAASILASCWNEFVLKKPHAKLQDTNDYYLANIQKNGTYSVVPRIPGGEITPDKLLAIGRVAKKFNLYTKITGGQRIDLFGAQVHELPLIWEELIAAGFESGHAYGKSLRTVKSCVGSTWCRYGVQDSAKMAIDLENRYKGLRSPHKLKFAVSGCTRECAEAQSKDVGVIATEKGWNLYVCGNGGMRPRHAELLAGDLDDASLIRYIDRFLMFYVRTADRLQRTSVWRDSLEGGLDYLKDVVLNDSLGIAAELEAEMASVVGTYACEWKRAVEDPEVRQRFRHFVNSEAPDRDVQWVSERGQIRPAREEEKPALAGIPVVMETA